MSARMSLGQRNFCADMSRLAPVPSTRVAHWPLSSQMERLIVRGLLILRGVAIFHFLLNWKRVALRIYLQRLEVSIPGPAL
jgi:hypothetical protein